MDTKLFNRKQGTGMFAITGKDPTTGTIFWVDSTNSLATDATGYGVNPDYPFATIDYAVGKCTANKGDIIYVMPNHAETVSGAGGIALDIAGIKLIGMGEGDDMPTITFSATTSTLTVSASNITVKNFICLATAAIVTTVIVTGEYATLKNLLFIGDAADETHKIPIITTAAANDLTIDAVNVQLLVAEDGTTAITTTSTEAIRLVGTDRATVQNCYLSGDFTTSAINGITTASKDIIVNHNRVNNVATENITGGIDLVTACTGYVDDNRVYVAYATGNTALIDAASCVLGLNWVSNVVSEQPVLHGTVEAGGAEGKVDSVGLLVSTVDKEIAVIDGEISTIDQEVSLLHSKANSWYVLQTSMFSTLDSKIDSV